MFEGVCAGRYSSQDKQDWNTQALEGRGCADEAHVGNEDVGRTRAGVVYCELPYSGLVYSKNMRRESLVQRNGSSRLAYMERYKASRQKFFAKSHACASWMY